MIITILLLVVLAFVLSGLFAGSEMAYLSCNKLKLRHLADEGNVGACRAMEFHKNPKRFLTMILIGNNFMNVTIVGLCTFLFESQFHITEEWKIALIISFPIIVFAETIPKDWFRHRSDDFIYRFAPLLSFLNRVLSPISDNLVRLSDWMIQMTTGEPKLNPIITREEFRYVIEESAQGGVLHDHEKRLIHSILNLSSGRVSEGMVPLSKFPRVSLTSKVREVKQIARRTGTRAILVYEELPSLIVGIIYVFDVLFEENEEASLSRFLRAPLFMHQEMSVEKAMILLQSKHATYGAVINESREVTGVVRLENLIHT
jgi:putative hemolysin